MEVSGQLQAPAILPPGNNPGTHWTGGCVDPTPGSEEEEISCSSRIQTPDCPACSIIVIPSDYMTHVKCFLSYTLHNDCSMYGDSDVVMKEELSAEIFMVSFLHTYVRMFQSFHDQHGEIHSDYMKQFHVQGCVITLNSTDGDSKVAETYLGETK